MGYSVDERDAAILSGKQPLYDGFGELHSAGAWAQLLLVDRSTLWRNLRRGVSVEDFAKARGITYPDPRKKDLPRVKERGRLIGVTAFLIRELLLTSGYDAVGLKILPGRGRQKYQIMHDGTTIGLYDYGADRLELSGGDSTRLVKPIAGDVQIVQQEGKWYLHPRY